jgi:hypothetical protein
MNTIEILSEVFTFTEQNGLEAQVFADAITETSHVPMPIVNVLHDRLLASVAKGQGDLNVTPLQQSVREDAGLSATNN